MIRICRIQNMGRIKADIKLAAVCKMPHPIEDVSVCPELAAGDALFAFKTKAKADNTWNMEMFKTCYVPEYLKILAKPEARRLLNQIYKESKAGKTIAIGCYCADEAMCHRSIIAGLLQAIGCEVTGVKDDYTDYYRQYKRIKFMVDFGNAKAA